MPRTSERQRLLGEIIDVLAVAILEEEADDELLELYGDGVLQRVLGSDDISSPVEDLMDLLALVESRRYLEGHGRLPKCVEFRENGIQALAAMDFRQTTRVSHISFSRILSEIENHGVFQNYSDCGQTPVWLQLAVALDRLGNYGNGASLGRTQKLWGIGHGTCALYTTRILLALKDLASSYVVWPSTEERRSMSRRMGLKGFRGCVGFIDGTTIPLSQKPAVDGACFFDRKHRYSVNAQVVCDDRRRILAFYSGWPGSCADSTVYREMAIANSASKPHFFSQGEYLIADSAYPADVECNTLVPAYKASMKGSNIEDFNTCIAHVRVVNEHTIGVLKGRWYSLKELRIQIRKKADMERINLWLTACVVLHNMLIAFSDEWCEEYQSESESDSEDEENNANSCDQDEFVFRRELKRRAIAKACQYGGILWARGRSKKQ